MELESNKSEDVRLSKRSLKPFSLGRLQNSLNLQCQNVVHFKTGSGRIFWYDHLYCIGEFYAAFGIIWNAKSINRRGIIIQDRKSDRPHTQDYYEFNLNIAMAAAYMQPWRRTKTD